MTAHRKAEPEPAEEGGDNPPSPQQPESPTLSSTSAEHEDDDDRLSLSSSDLEASWLEIGVPRGLTDSMSASGFGSSTISEMAISDRASEPSERGDETDGWALSSDAGSELQTDPELHSADEAEDHLETPGISPKAHTGHREDDPSTQAFQRSFIFPDPHSPSQSFSSSWTSGTCTATDNTPQRSLANLRTEQPMGDVKISRLVFTPKEETKEEVKPIPQARQLASLRSDSKTPTVESSAAAAAESFRATPPTTGRRWSVMACIFTLFIFFLEIGPTPDLGALLSHRLAPNGTTPSAVSTPSTTQALASKLSVPDVQIVRDAIAKLSTDVAARKDAPVAEITKETSAWSAVVRKKADAVTDFIIVPQTKSLSAVSKDAPKSACTCPPQECTCPPTSPAGAYAQYVVMLLEDYARWTGAFMTALFTSTREYLSEEAHIVARQLEHYRNMAALFVKSEPVRAAVESTLVATAASQDALRDAYAHAQARICADGRCDRAAASARSAARTAARNARVAATKAHRRAGDTITRARRGLDNVIRAGRDAADALGQSATKALEQTLEQMEQNLKQMEKYNAEQRAVPPQKAKQGPKSKWKAAPRFCTHKGSCNRREKGVHPHKRNLRPVESMNRRDKAAKQKLERGCRAHCGARGARKAR